MSILRVWNLRSRGLCAALLALGLAAVSVDEARASEKSDPGVRGKVAIAPELKRALVPMTAEQAKAVRSPARVRRPAGTVVPGVPTQPAAEIVVVLEGARSDQPAPRKLVVQGHRFVPSELLLPKAGNITIENKQGTKLTIVDGAGNALVSLEPGESKEAPLQAGLQSLVVEELPHAKASVRVLERARVLPIKDGGDIDFIPVDGGEYKLAFYHGVQPLYQQPFSLPEDKVYFIDASVSAQAVVTVSIKDATLRVAIPQAMPVPRETPPPPAPAAAEGDTP